MDRYILVKPRADILGYPDWLKSKVYYKNINNGEIVYVFQKTSEIYSIDCYSEGFGGEFVDFKYVEDYHWILEENSQISNFPAAKWNIFWEHYRNKHKLWLNFLNVYPEALNKIIKEYSKESYLELPSCPLIANYKGICKTPYLSTYSNTDIYQLQIFPKSSYLVYPIDISTPKRLLVAKKDGYYYGDKRISNVSFKEIYAYHDGYEFVLDNTSIFVPSNICISAYKFIKFMAQHQIYFFTKNEVIIYKLLNSAIKKNEKKEKIINILFDF